VYGIKDGRVGECETLATAIQNEHWRKTGFMPGFERLAEGRLARERTMHEPPRDPWRAGRDSNPRPPGSKNPKRRKAGEKKA